MGEILPTLTLQIGDLDEAAGVYPLRLYAGNLEIAQKTAIPKEMFDRRDAAQWEFDPVKKILEEPDATVEFKAIGRKLFALLHRGDVAVKWDEFRKNNQEHRVVLEIKAPEIAVFPWELAYSENINWLAVSKPKQSFIRFYEPDNAPPDFEGDSLPLRVLIVIGAEDDDQAVLPLEEVRRIETEIYDYDRAHEKNNLPHRMIDFEILKRPSLAVLENAYQEIKPHIFHFIGHGGINSDGEAFLQIKFQNENGELAELEFTHDLILAKFQAWEWLPRFVFINACRTEVAGLSDEQVQEQAWSIGGVFRQLGVPAILTMQADINGKAAGIFGAAVYKSLSKPELLDVALGYARSAMLVSTEQLKKRDWAVPVLTVSLPPEKIFPFKSPSVDLARIRACEAFKEIEPFTDRADVRRKLIRGFYPLPPSIADRNLIIVHGEEDAGKTWLVKWFLETCALLGNDVRYVEVGGAGDKNWLDVLLQIRGGDRQKRHSSLIYEELGETAFRRFYWELQNRFKQKEPPPLKRQKVSVKDDYQLSDSKWTPNFYNETLPSFVQALIQAAEINKPLIVVLDHFQGLLVDDMKNILIPGLLREAALGKLRLNLGADARREVKLIVVLTDQQFRDFEIATLIGGFYTVPIGLLSPQTFFDLASEYLRKVSRIEKLDYSEEDIRDAAEGIARLMIKRNQNYSPSELRKRFG